MNKSSLGSLLLHVCIEKLEKDSKITSMKNMCYDLLNSYLWFDIENSSLLYQFTKIISRLQIVQISPKNKNLYKSCKIFEVAN